MNNTNLTLGSLFSGSGGFELAGKLAGIKPVWNSEIDPYCTLVTRKRLPEVRHYGDVCKLNGADLEPVDIITFGSPCQDLSIAGKRVGIIDGTRSNLFFEAIRIIKEMRTATNGKYPRYAVWENVCFHEDTLITCENGYKRIRDIAIGDRVKTHTGRYKPVVKVHQTKKKQTITLKVCGSEDITVTPNHPFLAVQKIYNGDRVVGTTEPKWTSAGELTNKHLIGYRIDAPTLPEDFITESEAWAVGRWLADGSVDLNKSNPRMFFSIGIGKESDARVHLNQLPYTIYENKPHPTATNFCFTSHEFYTFIADAGVGAGNKRVPPYVFQLPFYLQKAVLDGYISGDGYVRQRGKHIELSAGTASRELAYGICRLIRNVYRTAPNISVRTVKNVSIEGRELNVNYPTYLISASLTTTTLKSIIGENIIWQPIKAVEYTNKKYTVYNLSVLDDNTYAANDVIVHNCGAFSSNKGDDFYEVLRAFCTVKNTEISVPRYEGKWLGAGEIMGDDFSVAWRTLDSEYWGVPQRRRRIFLVADFAGASAGKVLFESESVPRDITQSGYPWQGTAACAESSSGAAGKKLCLNDQGGERMDITEDKTATLRAKANHPPIVFENHSADTRYTGPLEVAPTIGASLGTGGNNQPFVVEPAYSLQRESFNSGAKANFNFSINEEVSLTLAASGPHAVAEPHAYDVRFTSEGTKNWRANVYKTDTARTLDTGGCPPECNQGGVAVVTYSTSKNSHHTQAEENIANTLVASDYKDPPTVVYEPYYIVRRLTPTECGRLQGFKDDWCDDLAIEDPSDDEMAFWKKVYEEFGKPKTEKQIRKWLKNPYSDSKAYSMWGNGLALPCPYYVLSGIVYYSQLPDFLF